MGHVNYLLDTHTLLWAVRGSKDLSDTVKNIILDTNALVFVSSVSAYEIMNKHRIGKLQGFEDVANNYFKAVHELGADDLVINAQHTHFAGKFDWGHKDPFDRLLAAQASLENMTLITNDLVFKTLSCIECLW